MKTETITFHAPNNNGSFLQAYALQKILINKLNVENEIIDFRSDNQISQYSVFRKPNNIGDIVRNMISLVHFKDLKRRYERFEIIRNKYLYLSKRCKTASEVCEISNNYDKLICGSDQIWNTDARDYSDAYFLTESKKPKISYAASFGSHIEDIDKNRIKDNIKSFEHISVRESAGKKLINEIAPNIDTELVCDPTLLLEKSKYDELISKRIIDHPYIFLYTISYSDDVLSAAQKLSEKMQLPVYAAFTGYSCIKCLKYGVKLVYDAGPAEFLNLIENAQYTCSNSFHGIVFSIIFEKSFCRLISLDEAGLPVLDDRIDSLLNQLGLDERIMSVDSISSQAMKKPIDYNFVNKKINEIREKGITFLENSILK